MAVVENAYDYYDYYENLYKASTATANSFRRTDGETVSSAFKVSLSAVWASVFRAACLTCMIQITDILQMCVCTHTRQGHL
jgi:hypothetical protein